MVLFDSGVSMFSWGGGTDLLALRDQAVQGFDHGFSPFGSELLFFL